MKRHLLTLIVLLLLHFNNFAQSTFELGFLPTLNINKKLPKDWSLNFKTESRQSLIKDDFNYDYLLTDISLAASKKIGINTSVAMGYLMRIDDEGIRNRTIQQITFVKRYTGFRLSHRFLADQTFEKDDETEFRFRYRISSEIPLQGKSLDPKEFFLKINNEYLNSIQDKNYDLEIRGGAFLGYVLSPKNLIELGLDNRLDSFIEGNPRNRFWIGLNFYMSF
jgi:hypothetical protein